MNIHQPRKTPGSLRRWSLGLGTVFALGWLALHLNPPARPDPANPAGPPLPPSPVLAHASPETPVLAPTVPAYPTEPTNALRRFLRNMEDCDCPELLGPFFARHLTPENAHDFLALLQERDQWQEIAVLLTFWAKLDPEEAFLTAFHHLSAEHYETSASALLDQWLARADAETVFAHLNQSNDPDRVVLLIESMARQTSRLDPTELHAWLSRWTQPRLRAEAEHALFSALARNDPQRGADFFASRPDFQLREVVPLIIGRQWMVSDPAAAIAWTLTLPPEIAETAFAEGIGALGLVDPLRAEQTLVQFLENTPAADHPFSPDLALFELIILLARTHPDQAARWTHLVHNPDLREAGKQLLSRR